MILNDLIIVHLNAFAKSFFYKLKVKKGGFLMNNFISKKLKLFFSLLSVILIILFISVCAAPGGSSGGGGGGGGDGEGPSITGGNDITFWAIDTTKDINTAAAWYQINASLVKNNTNCLIYLQENKSVLVSAIDSIANAFDNSIWNIVNTNFATPTDIDSNGKVILLLMDIKDNYPAVSSYVGGYFFSLDLYDNVDLPGLGYPNCKSNEAEILYIDINPNNPSSVNCRSTVAHEFQHLACYSRNVMVENAGDSSKNLPVWINEGFSTVAEAIYQNVYILASRENWYDNDPLLTGAYGVPINTGRSISYGYPLVAWNIYGDSYAVLNNYAMSHLFFAWLRIHMGTNTFFKTIHDNPVDNTVNAVLTVCGATAGNTFPEMLGKWYMANLLGGNGKTSGLESYNGLNTHLGPYTFDSPNDDVQLYPSGAFHFRSDNYNGWSPAGGDAQIDYELGNISTDTADYIAPFGTGNNTTEALIVFNNESSGAVAGTSAALPASIEFSLEKSIATKESAQKLNRNTDIKKENPPEDVFKIGLEPKGPKLKELNNFR